MTARWAPPAIVPAAGVTVSQVAVAPNWKSAGAVPVLCRSTVAEELTEPRSRVLCDSTTLTFAPTMLALARAAPTGNAPGCVFPGCPDEPSTPPAAGAPAAWMPVPGAEDAAAEVRPPSPDSFPEADTDMGVTAVTGCRPGGTPHPPDRRRR